MFSDLTAASVAGGGAVVLKLSGTPQPLATAELAVSLGLAGTWRAECGGSNTITICVMISNQENGLWQEINIMNGQGKVHNQH